MSTENSSPECQAGHQLRRSSLRRVDTKRGEMNLLQQLHAEDLWGRRLHPHPSRRRPKREDIGKTEDYGHPVICWLSVDTSRRSRRRSLGWLVTAMFGPICARTIAACQTRFVICQCLINLAFIHTG